MPGRRKTRVTTSQPLKEEWTDEEFFASGEQTVAEEILTDMINICQGKDPKQMRVIEIGCGAGRITRALAETFRRSARGGCKRRDGAQAGQALAETPNAFVYQNNGMDLSVIPRADNTISRSQRSCFSTSPAVK